MLRKRWEKLCELSWCDVGRFCRGLVYVRGRLAGEPLVRQALQPVGRELAGDEHELSLQAHRKVHAAAAIVGHASA